MSTTPPDGPDQPSGSWGGSQPEDRPSEGQGAYGQGAYGHGGYPQAGYGQNGYQSAPGYYGGPPTSDRDNNYGVIALVTGILSLLVCQPVGIAAIIYGRKAQAAQAAGTANNGSLGTVGFWLGVVALALMVLAILLLLTGVLTLGMFGAQSY